MSGLCGKLDLFVDDELTPIDAENFRHHLTHCGACASRLEDVLQLELLTARTFRRSAEPRADQRPPPLWRRAWALAPAAALAAGLLVFLWPGRRAIPPEVWLAQASVRRLEPRVSYGPADTWRSYEPMLGSGPAQAAPPPLEPLARLQARGDLRGIAAAYLVRSDWKQAATFLESVPASPDRDNDRAVVAMGSGRLEEALMLLQAAIQAQPTHPQALWNQGLVLNELGLTRRAEESFARVAGLGEPGWSREAGARAAGLRQRWQPLEGSWRASLDATLAQLQRPGAPLPLDQARRQPEVVRAALYEAVRSATRREEVERLLPLAEALDRQGTGSTLRDYVLATAARDFARRGPLARDYARLLRGEHLDPEALLAQLRRSGEEDLLLGALLRVHPAPEDRERLASWADHSADPWLRLLTQGALARAEETAGQPLQAGKLWIAASRTCRDLKLPNTCAAFE